MSNEESTLKTCNLLNETLIVNGVTEDDAISGLITVLINYLFEKSVPEKEINKLQKQFNNCIVQCKMKSKVVDVGDK
jgi:hypothetical protein